MEGELKMISVGRSGGIKAGSSTVQYDSWELLSLTIVIEYSTRVSIVHT
jgi:hypothetical protein